MQVVRLSALRTTGTHCCQRKSRPQGHSAAGRTESLKNSNDTVRYGIRDLPACSALPEPTALPRAPIMIIVFNFTWFSINIITVLVRVRVCVCVYTHSLSLYSICLSAKGNWSFFYVYVYKGTWIFRKWEGVVRTGWSWLRIGTGGGHL